MNIKDLLTGCEYKSADVMLPDIEHITRIPSEVTERSLYFHFYGSRAKDGGELTFNNAPVAIVAEEGSAPDIPNIPLIYVRSSREAYSYAWSNFCGVDYSAIRFIGITGTNGKTSTSVMLKKIFDTSGHKTGLIGTGKIVSGERLLTGDEYSMTSPDAEMLFPALKEMQKDGCDTVIMEVSSHALALGKVTPIPFTLAIFTGLSSEHLDFHKDLAHYFAEKRKLIEKAHHSVINADDTYGRRLIDEFHDKCMGVGILWRSDASASDIEYLGLDGLKYIYATKNCKTAVTLRLCGYCNIYNSMFAIAAATALGISPKVCKDALYEIASIKGRFEIIRDEINVIIDYAHTPFALETLLKSLNMAQITRQNITIVFGCGGERDKGKRPLMAVAAQKGAARVIVTTDNSRSEDPHSIIKDIVSGFSSSDYAVITDRALAITYAIKTATRSSTVVIVGKGAEPYILDGDGYHPFNEREIIRKALKERKGHTV